MPVEDKALALDEEGYQLAFTAQVEISYRQLIKLQASLAQGAGRHPVDAVFCDQDTHCARRTGRDWQGRRVRLAGNEQEQRQR
jgi:hypothetical protein